jgi:hypothetical protein
MCLGSISKSKRGNARELHGAHIDELSQGSELVRIRLHQKVDRQYEDIDFSR